MVQPLPRIKRSLTGRTTVRRAWTGRFILQVEEELQAFDGSGSGQKLWTQHRWRDALVDDLIHHKLIIPALQAPPPVQPPPKHP